MPLQFIELRNLNQSVKFNYVSFIPFVIIDNVAYPLLGVSTGPTLVDLGGSIKDNIPIHIILAQAFYEKTSRTFSITANDILENAVILYTDSKDVKSSRNDCVVFLNIDIANNIEDLNFICKNFRKNFISEYHKDNESPFCSVTNLLWINQLNFIYLCRNTTYTDGSLDSNNELIRKSPVDNMIPINESLKDIYKINPGEYPIIQSTYNKKFNVPPYFINYPSMDPFLLSFLTDAFNEKIDFFGTDLFGEK